MLNIRGHKITDKSINRLIEDANVSILNIQHVLTTYVQITSKYCILQIFAKIVNYY